MVLLQTLLIGVAFLLALLYCGFGATRFLLPPPLRAWRAWLMPFVGSALIVVWDYLALFLNVNLTLATLALLAAATAANAAALWRERPTLPRPPFIRGRVEAAVLAIALLTFLVAVAPLGRYGYTTLIGENWDYEFYLPLADALSQYATNQLAQAPANPLLNTILARHILPLPMGFAYLQSTLDVIFRLEAFDSFAVLLALSRALGVVSAFVFFRATLKMSPRGALAATVLVALNGLLLWATYWGFGLQLVSLALLPLALMFGAAALLERPRRFTESPLALAALLLAALNVTFHPTLVAALLPLSIIGLYALIARSERLRTLAAGAGLIVGAMALSFPTLFHIQDFIREYYGREPLATGLRDFIPLGDPYGLSNYSLELVVGHTIPTPVLYNLAARVWDFAAPVLLIFALAASAFALWRLCRDAERRALWYAIVGASVLYVAVFRLSFLHPYPYGFMKSLTLVSFVLIALAVQGISDLRLWIADLGLGFTPHVSRFTFHVSRFTFHVSRFAFYALTLFTFGLTLEQYFKPAPAFFNADDLRIRALPQILPRGATVFLTDRREVQKIPLGLVAYVLREFPLRGDVQTGYGKMNNAAAGAVYEHALLARGEDPRGRGYQAAPLWANQKFALYPRAPGVTYHRNFNARAVAPDALYFTIGANAIVTGTQTLAPTTATRGVSLALASFVTQTVTLQLGATAQTVALEPGLAVYTFSQAQLPSLLTITARAAPEEQDVETALFVPWLELNDGRDVQLSIPTMSNVLLVRCTSESAADLNARCFIANPRGVELRWEWVVRGAPQGTYEDQELIRRAVVASPRHVVEINAAGLTGLGALEFDAAPPTRFPPQKLVDGKYRAALEIFDGDILLAWLELYNFTLAKQGHALTRSSPQDPPLVIVQP